ncbi:MAG TPA: 1-(5-phosphoribosyl)-5-[(5-phosphoribosylamino)methylideneamino] imidazole-4-carboxamide isomerase [Thermoanaerobaculia bacterium]|nr:1-(5-phosphoribosyl)-5-[(5-phosphoribosylamino)methylideneamino] imidazole-4-carboxamide isomerase [Thermoanaerobaculia bacterium]
MRELCLWPAIDLMAGRVVRLLRGEAAQATFYDADPVDVARRFEAEGADGVHVVDLDAAFGKGENGETIRSILGALSIPVQVGGGLRSREAVERLLGSTAGRAVLGSLPFAEPGLFAEILASHRERLVVALDCRDGRPTTKGWTEDAASGTAKESAARFEALGVAALLVTDVARDGAMQGPNVALLEEIRSVFSGEILASGGMRGVEDLAPVDAVLSGGPRGAIFGRALHDGKTTVAALRAARDATVRKAEKVGTGR